MRLYLLFFLQGRWAPDPRHERITFVEACRRGDIGTVKAKLIAGADVNWVDDTECK